MYSFSFVADENRSFKLRLPSLRSDIRKLRRKSRPDDVEHHAVDPADSELLHIIHIPPNSLPTLGERVALDRELSDLSAWSNEDFRSSHKSSQGSLRKASSMEGLECSRLPSTYTANQLKGSTFGSGTCSANHRRCCLGSTVMLFTFFCSA